MYLCNRLLQLRGSSLLPPFLWAQTALYPPYPPCRAAFVVFAFGVARSVDDDATGPRKKSTVVQAGTICINEDLGAVFESADKFKTGWCDRAHKARCEKCLWPINTRSRRSELCGHHASCVGSETSHFSLYFIFMCYPGFIFFIFVSSREAKRATHGNMLNRSDRVIIRMSVSVS